MQEVHAAGGSRPRYNGEVSLLQAAHQPGPGLSNRNLRQRQPGVPDAFRQILAPAALPAACHAHAGIPPCRAGAPVPNPQLPQVPNSDARPAHGRRPGRAVPELPARVLDRI